MLAAIGIYLKYQLRVFNRSFSNYCNIRYNTDHECDNRIKVHVIQLEIAKQLKSLMFGTVSYYYPQAGV